MSTSLVNLVDPFHGNGVTDLPAPQGLACAWNWRKAQVGNTHPGATLPFGMVSACAYSGAYPTGYGVYDRSTTGAPERLFDRKTALGFTHFQHSGVGDVGIFYNFLRVAPLRRIEDRDVRWTLADETARPGCYAATLSETGIRCELAAGCKSILHRYTLPQPGPFTLALDCSSGGLVIPGREQYRIRPARAAAEISPGGAAGGIISSGFPIFFAMETDLEGTEHGLWIGDAVRPGERALSVDSSAPASYGLYFVSPRADGPVTLRIAFSFRSVEQARRNLDEIRGQSVEAVSARASGEWEERLGRIRVKGGSSEQQGIFYSCLYHSLVKPALGDGESPHWPGDGPFATDFATLWDTYKTQTPLLMALYPDCGKKIVATFLKTMQTRGMVPVADIMADGPDICANVASGLSVYALAEAFFRGTDGVDWHDVIHASARALRQGYGAAYEKDGLARPITHTLDIAGACRSLACMARTLGDSKTAAGMDELARFWRNAYDLKTGMLREDETYYEGTLWNYSFRQHPFMRERVGLFRSSSEFVAALDVFFGYDDIRSGVINPSPAPGEFKRLRRDNRFEGLNNECDMEAPYAYLWAGRHDRTAEIVRAAMRYQYGSGPGGLPGNDDSGGLSAWYVWNAVGLCPLAGRGVYLVGSPLFPETALAFPRGTLTVRAAGASEKNIHVQSASLNGASLDRAWLTAHELEGGGELRFVMGPEPAGWAARDAGCPD